MKAKYIYTVMMAMALTIGLGSCSDDDDPQPNPQPTAKSELKCDMDTVKVGVGETATFNILEGGGDYRVICENTDVATATISGTAITVNSTKKGLTGLVISDADGNYKRIVVKSMYFQLIVDTENVKVGMKLGHTDGYGTIKMLGGNGNYTVTVADESVARVYRVTDEAITLQGVAAGQTTCTITDIMGLQKTVNVTVETTTVPFTEAEKEEIMAITSNEFNWNGSGDYGWGTFSCTTTDGVTTAKWDYYGYYQLSCTWNGDNTVGKKGTGKFLYKMSWGGSGTTYDVDVEIIKNDGSRIWGICSCIQDDYLNTGYFTVAL